MQDVDIFAVTELEQKMDEAYFKRKLKLAVDNKMNGRTSPVHERRGSVDS
jgi:hypothetical protein